MWLRILSGEIIPEYLSAPNIITCLYKGKREAGDSEEIDDGSRGWNYVIGSFEDRKGPQVKECKTASRVWERQVMVCHHPRKGRQ